MSRGWTIFYRINTGAVPLSSQELRQVLNRDEFSKYLLQVTADQNPLWDVLGIDAPDPRLRDVELLLRLIALQRFSASYQGSMKAFLDNSMKNLNNNWSIQRSDIEHLTERVLKSADATIKIFGADAGREYKGGRYERALNCALFEIQTYYLSFSNIRKAALENKSKVLAAAKDLFNDSGFLTSIESTTTSVDNYRTDCQNTRRCSEAFSE